MATYPDSGAMRSTPAWKQRLASFWRWWTGELAQLVPSQFSALRGASRVPLVMIEGDDVIVVEPRIADVQHSRVALDALDAQRRRQAVRSLLERAGETRGRARACLAPHEALARKVTLPAATEENLPQVLAFEMDRLTPFRAEEVYFDHRVVSRDAAAGTIGVMIAVARREIVDARVQALRALGISVQGVALRDETHAAAGLDLLPLEQRGERETARERSIRLALLATVGVLLVAALAVPLAIKRERVKELMPQLARAQAEAQSTDVLAKDVEKQVADYNFLLNKRHTTPPVLAYIEEVTRLLPDNTWAQQMDLRMAGKTRELQVQGETPSSSRLIEVLEQSTLIAKAETRGSLTRGSTPGTERFTIAAEPKVRPPPEPRPLSELANVPPPQPTALPRMEPPKLDVPPAPQPAKVEPVKPSAPTPTPTPGKAPAPAATPVQQSAPLPPSVTNPPYPPGPPPPVGTSRIGPDGKPQRTPGK